MTDLDGPPPSPEYVIALRVATKATRVWNIVRERYRRGSLSDEKFFIAQEAHKNAQAAFDVAFAKESNR